jgi:hypothetical protein
MATTPDQRHSDCSRRERPLQCWTGAYLEGQGEEDENQPNLEMDERAEAGNDGLQKAGGRPRGRQHRHKRPQRQLERGG